MIRSSQYPLILIFCCYAVAFMFVVKHEVPKRRRFRVAVPKLLIVWKRVLEI